jgi:hypothetical protein
MGAVPRRLLGIVIKLRKCMCTAMCCAVAASCGSAAAVSSKGRPSDKGMSVLTRVQKDFASLESVAARYGTLWLTVGPPPTSATADLVEVTRDSVRLRVNFKPNSGSGVENVSVGDGQVLVSANPGPQLTSLVLLLKGTKLISIQPNYATLGVISPTGKVSYVVQDVAPSAPIGKFFVEEKNKASDEKRSRVFTGLNISSVSWQSGSSLGILLTQQKTTTVRFRTIGNKSTATPVRAIRTGLPSGSSLTGRGRYVSVVGPAKAYVFDIGSGHRRPFPASWHPVCWPRPGAALVVQERETRSGHVIDGEMGIANVDTTGSIIVHKLGKSWPGSAVVYNGACQ